MQGSQLAAGGQVCVTRSRAGPGSPGAGPTEFLAFWFSGLRAGRGRSWDIRGLVEGKDLAVKHPGVKFMDRETCSPSPQAEGGWEDGSPQAVHCIFFWGTRESRQRDYGRSETVGI